jgi:hypothetical protein
MKWWTDPTWQVLHVYGLVQRHRPITPQFERLLQAFAENLPCPKCSPHMQAFLQQFPPVESGLNPFQYTVALHNDVNRRLGKCLLSYEDALDMWTRRVNTIEGGSGVAKARVLAGVGVGFSAVLLLALLVLLVIKLRKR